MILDEKFRRVLLSVIFCVFCSFLWQCFLHPYRVGEPVTIAMEKGGGEKILLVPLDSRPPCRQAVVDLGAVAGMDVLLPPAKLLDYYSLAGETAQMRQWLKDNIKTADAVILSVDQLLYGGLLAAREKKIDGAQGEELLRFLRELRADAPNVPIYAFNILPRLLPPDNLGDAKTRRKLAEYARLVGKKRVGLPVDEDELATLVGDVPSEILREYEARFVDNRILNEKLTLLVKEGVVTEIFFGQDDGEPYGLPNIEKERLRRFIESENLQGCATITHGADELATSILARITCADNKPKVFVHYADAATQWRVMPYMAVGMRDLAEEKIALVGGQAVASEDVADFVLVIHAAENAANLLPTAKFIEEQVACGRRVALVDLGVHFSAEETLLPQLVRRDTPINALVAYSGWNTASNSVGTTVAQGAIFCARLREYADDRAAKSLYAANLRILHNRIVEDNFYLKSGIDAVNGALKKYGFINPADLDLTKNYRFANAMMQKSLKERTAIYKSSRAFRRPFAVSLPSGEKEFFADDLAIEASYPWPRTFEIFLESSLWVYE